MVTIANNKEYVKRRIASVGDFTPKIPGRTMIEPSDAEAKFDKTAEATLTWPGVNSITNINIYSNRQGDCVSSNIKWVKIAFIEFVGYERVYDIEVEGTHNFVAGYFVKKKSERSKFHQVKSSKSKVQSLTKGDSVKDQSFSLRFKNT